jgi:hypothetical protein
VWGSKCLCKVGYNKSPLLVAFNHSERTGRSKTLKSSEDSSEESPEESSEGSSEESSEGSSEESSEGLSEESSEESSGEEGVEYAPDSVRFVRFSRR